MSPGDVTAENRWGDPGRYMLRRRPEYCEDGGAGGEAAGIARAADGNPSA